MSMFFAENGTQYFYDYSTITLYERFMIFVFEGWGGVLLFGLAIIAINMIASALKSRKKKASDGSHSETKKKGRTNLSNQDSSNPQPQAKSVVRPIKTQKRKSNFVKKAPFWLRQFIDSDLKKVMDDEREAQKAKVLKRLAIKELEEKNQELISMFNEIEQKKALIEKALMASTAMLQATTNADNVEPVKAPTTTAPLVTFIEDMPSSEKASAAHKANDAQVDSESESTEELLQNRPSRRNASRRMQMIQNHPTSRKNRNRSTATNVA